MVKTQDIFCLIMAGGSGTRFWPRSKNTQPKQFINIFGDETLLELTVKRFKNITAPENIYIVSNKQQAGILEKQDTGLSLGNLIYEPVGKNTLPCIGLAALFAEKENPESVMVVSPADHLIRNNSIFNDTILSAVNLAQKKDGIVTIGIPPDYAAPGYGYVQTEDLVGEENNTRQFKVKQFVEKPDEKTAAQYLESGNYYWNSGLFVFKVSVFLEAINKFAPALYTDLKKIQEKIGQPEFDQTLDKIYREVESISVDYGIMEHADNIYLVEGNFDWNDLGSWESVYLASEDKDENGNVQSGENILMNTKNSYVHSDDSLIALVGMEDVVVVQDKNTILVCNREDAEDVKKIVNKLKGENKQEFL